MRAQALAWFAVAAVAACTAGDPPGFDTPECALHDEVADVYLVSNIRGAPLAKDGNGYIARVSPDDGSMRRYWIEGGKNGVTLHAPKGMAIVGDVLWVADIDVVREFDRTSGAPRGEVAIPGATFLNDVTAAADGTVYVSDTGLDANFQPTGTDAIWRLGSDGSVTAVVRGPDLGQPNGVLVHRDGLYVASWRDGTVQLVARDGKRTGLYRADQPQLDGLVRVEAAEPGAAPFWLASSWAGRCIYRFDLAGGVTRLPKDFEQPADLGFDKKRRRLLVPLFAANRLEIVPL